MKLGTLNTVENVHNTADTKYSVSRVAKIAVITIENARNTADMKYSVYPVAVKSKDKRDSIRR